MIAWGMPRASILDWPALAADYGEYHRHPKNRLCHAIGIPIIVLCLLRWTFWPGTAWPLLAALLPLYMVWDLPLGLAMAVVLAGLAAAAARLPGALFLPLFILGWILQFVGHWYEGRSPAFTRNVTHLLVGPLWILGETGMAKFFR